MLRREVHARAALRWTPWWLGGLAIVFVIGARLASYFEGYFGVSEVEIARQIAYRYAHTTYHVWLAAHPEQPCPTLEQMGVEVKDPWGGDYQRVCGPDVMFVWSAGEDAKLGTDDDIHSW